MTSKKIYYVCQKASLSQASVCPYSRVSRGASIANKKKILAGREKKKNNQVPQKPYCISVDKVHITYVFALNGRQATVKKTSEVKVHSGHYLIIPCFCNRPKRLQCLLSRKTKACKFTGQCQIKKKKIFPLFKSGLVQVLIQLREKMQSAGGSNITVAVTQLNRKCRNLSITQIPQSLNLAAQRMETETVPIFPSSNLNKTSPVFGSTVKKKKRSLQLQDGHHLCFQLCYVNFIHSNTSYCN